MNELPPCDMDLFNRGTVVGMYITDGAADFEEKIKRVRDESSRAVDWHYVAGRAIVKCWEVDRAIVIPVLERICGDRGPV